MNGEVCRDDQECVAGYCAFDGACPGRCAPFKPLSASCSGSECGPGRGCGWLDATSAPVCIAQTAPGRDGQPCSNGYPLCALGNFCDRSGTCRAQVAVGGACSGLLDEPCAGGAFCLDGRCRALARAGESCAEAECRADAFCSPATVTCVASPTLGQDCTVAGRCADASICTGSTGKKTCVAPPTAGQDCTATSWCSDGTSCVGATTRTCVRLTVGQDCTWIAGYPICSDGSYCLGDATRRCTFGTAALGAACDLVPGTDPGKLCAPPATRKGLVGCQPDASGTLRCTTLLSSCY